MENPRLAFLSPTLLDDRDALALGGRARAVARVERQPRDRGVGRALLAQRGVHRVGRAAAHRRRRRRGGGAARTRRRAGATLDGALAAFAAQPERTRLQLALDGVDPDEGLSIVPYEKGYLLLARARGRARRRRASARFVRDWFARFAGRVGDQRGLPRASPPSACAALRLRELVKPIRAAGGRRQRRERGRERGGARAAAELVEPIDGGADPAAAADLSGALPRSGRDAPRQRGCTGSIATATIRSRASSSSGCSASRASPSRRSSRWGSGAAPLDDARHERYIFVYGYGDTFARPRLHRRLAPPVRRPDARPPAQPRRAGGADGRRADGHHRAAAAARLDPPRQAARSGAGARPQGRRLDLLRGERGDDAAGGARAVEAAAQPDPGRRHRQRPQAHAAAGARARQGAVVARRRRRADGAPLLAGAHLGGGGARAHRPAAPRRRARRRQRRRRHRAAPGAARASR